MTVEDLDAKIKARREELKIGRIAETNRDIESDYPGHDQSERTAFQATGRAVERLASHNRKLEEYNSQPGNNGRGAKTELVRVGRTDRRFSDDNSSLAVHTADHATASTRAVGRMIADGPIPERMQLNPDAPVEQFDLDEKTSTLDKHPKAIEILSSDPGISGRQLAIALNVSAPIGSKIKKEWEERNGKASSETSDQASAQTNDQASAQTSGGAIKLPNIQNIFKTSSEQSNKSTGTSSKTLTKVEVAELQETLVSALESDFQALDEYLWHRQLAVGTDTDEQPVWSDLDEEEIQKLTKIMLKWGQRNATAATVVRGVVESSDYIAVASIFVPRIKSTVDIVRKTRKPRTRRGQKDEN